MASYYCGPAPKADCSPPDCDCPPPDCPPPSSSDGSKNTLKIPDTRFANNKK